MPSSTCELQRKAQKMQHLSEISCCAGVSGRIQHSRLTVMLAPRECDLTNLVKVLSARAPRGTMLSGSASVTVGGSSASLAQCRRLIGFASEVRC